MATMRSKKGVTREFEGNFGPAVILLMIMSGVIYYVIISTPTERAKIGIEEIKFEKVDLDVTPGLVTSSPPSAVSNVEHSLETLILDGRPAVHTTLLRDLMTLRSSAVSKQDARISFAIAKEPTVTAKITGAVQSRQGSGKLAVTLNDKEIFSEVAEASKPIEVVLPNDALADGQNNLVISVSSPILATEYKLSGLNLEALQYDDTKLSAEASFKLSEAEFDGLQRVTLDAFVKATKPGEIKISANGNMIYSGKPAEVFEADVPANYLKSGSNVLAFSTVRDVAYKINFGKVTTKFSTEAGGQKSYDFEVSQFLADGAKAKTYSCTLTLTKTSGGDIVRIGLNGVTASNTFADNTLVVNICKYIKSGTNTLSLSADQDVTIDRAVVRFKQV